MDPCEAVRESTAAVVAEEGGHSNVFICGDAVAGFVETLMNEGGLQDLPDFDKGIHYVDTEDPETTARYLFVLDAVNFCFWPAPDIEYEDLSTGLKASIEQQGKEVLNSERLVRIDERGVQELLRLPHLPLCAERARFIREIGYAIAANGSATAIIQQAKNSATRLVELITSILPGFRDHSVYRGRQIFFLKRAQILVGDIYGAFGGRSLGEFHDIHKLTMFADYRVPVVLRELGIISYSQELKAKIDSQVEILPGSEEEIQIRSASIVAVDRIQSSLAEALLQKGISHPPMALHIDWFLWSRGEMRRKVDSPHHRTLTVYY